MRRIEFKVSNAASELFRVLHPGMDVVVFDTETTGLGKTSKIIQFSASRYAVSTDFKMHLKSTCNIHINPKEVLEDKIVELTGLTNEYLENCKEESEVVSEIIDFLESGDVWAAYNDKFDIRQIHQMCDRTHWLCEDRPSIDVLALAKGAIASCDVENYKLQTVFSYLFDDVGLRFHDASSDVEATVRVMEQLMQMYLDIPAGSEKLNVVSACPSYTLGTSNPRTRRLDIQLEEGLLGDIFYDCYLRRWRHRQTKSAKDLFDKVDLKYVEQEVLHRYSHMEPFPIHESCIDLLCIRLFRLCDTLKKARRNNTDVPTYVSQETGIGIESLQQYISGVDGDKDWIEQLLGIYSPKRLLTGDDVLRVYPLFPNEKYGNWKIRRLCLKLSEGENGDVFYDQFYHCWSHKKTPKAKKIFEKCDIPSIESQVLYIFRTEKHIRCSSIDELAEMYIGFCEKCSKEAKMKAKAN